MTPEEASEHYARRVSEMADAGVAVGRDERTKILGEILAIERERCAKLAEETDMDVGDYSNPEMYQAWVLCRKRIAKQIRKRGDL